MEQIKITIRIICLSALGVGIINSFVSNKKQAKTVNLITGMIFLLLVINPIIKSNYNFDKSIINNTMTDYNQSVEIDVESEIIRLTENKISKILIDELADSGITVKSLKVDCEADDDKSVIISSINCEIEEKEKVKFARKMLNERTENPECLTVY